MKINKNTFLTIFLFLLVVLAVAFIIWSIFSTDKEREQSCRESCQKYHLPYLKSERLPESYSCFCLDTDGKPRVVPYQ